MDVRTTSTTITHTHREAGVAVSPPTTIVTATVVVNNPLAGQGLVHDLSSLEQLGNESAALLIDMATASLSSAGISATHVRGYARERSSALMGSATHSCVLHPRFGALCARGSAWYRHHS